MRLTESKLRRVIRSVLKESIGSGPLLGKGYGCEVYGESIDFDSFVLKIVITKENIVEYAKDAVKMQEGEILNAEDTVTGEGTLIASFKNEVSSGKTQTPKLVATNIAFYVGR